MSAMGPVHGSDALQGWCMALGLMLPQLQASHSACPDPVCQDWVTCLDWVLCIALAQTYMPDLACTVTLSGLLGSP